MVFFAPPSNTVVVSETGRVWFVLFMTALKSVQCEGGPAAGSGHRKPHRHKDAGEFLPSRSRSERTEGRPGSGHQRGSTGPNAQHPHRPRGDLQELDQPDREPDGTEEVRMNDVETDSCVLI